MADYKEGFKVAFAALAKKAGLEDAELCTELDISLRSLANYKKGQLPNGAQLFKVADGFSRILSRRISFDYLLTGKEPAFAQASHQISLAKTPSTIIKSADMTKGDLMFALDEWWKAAEAKMEAKMEAKIKDEVLKELTRLVGDAKTQDKGETT